MSAAVAPDPARAPALEALLAAERARVRATLVAAVALAVCALVLGGLAAAGAALGGGRWLELPALGPAAAWGLLAAGAATLAARPVPVANAAPRASNDERLLSNVLPSTSPRVVVKLDGGRCDDRPAFRAALGGGAEIVAAAEAKSVSTAVLLFP